MSEGRCPACRLAKNDVHHTPTSYRPHILIASALLIVLLAVLAVHGIITRGGDPPEPPAALRARAAVPRRHTGHSPGTRPGSLGR